MRHKQLESPNNDTSNGGIFALIDGKISYKLCKIQKLEHLVIY
jgi:hypothetical protein